ncbi:J domain-containing protein [Leptotrichia trevisanii]|uniref:J domain-containing protein n=1 Tax=Leptotrichia trevisanii TaxID=109328 RepID=UPI0026F2DBE6|nr:J domain-containing protein [Leptotrichia trevisanii]
MKEIFSKYNPIVLRCIQMTMYVTGQLMKTIFIIFRPLIYIVVFIFSLFRIPIFFIPEPWLHMKLTGLIMLIICIFNLFLGGISQFIFFFSVILFIALPLLFEIESIGKFFGKFLDEKKEEEEIFQRYNKWFFEEMSQEYKNANFQNNNFYDYSAYSSDNMIKKYEEYLAYLEIDIHSEITKQRIKSAYRTKSKKLHPDLNKNVDTTSEMQKLNEVKVYLETNFDYYISQKRGN